MEDNQKLNCSNNKYDTMKIKPLLTSGKIIAAGALLIGLIVGCSQNQKENNQLDDQDTPENQWADPV